MSLLSDPEDLDAVRRQITMVAEQAGHEVAVVMLAEALRQMVQLGPALSGEVWDSYAEILAAAGQQWPSATVVTSPEQEGRH